MSFKEEERSPLQPPTYGNLITILSIDGGGVRGIIPSVILEFLETQLQVSFINLVTWIILFILKLNDHIRKF